MTEAELKEIRVRYTNAQDRTARADMLRLLDEVERLRASEESWNKEAERHERDHAGHYRERETLRAELRTLEESIAKLKAEVARQARLAEVWREILEAVNYEAQRIAICRTCPSNECQIRELCTSATACRSLYAIATAVNDKVP